MWATLVLVISVSVVSAAKDCLVTPWRAWTTCSQTCGGGTQERKRIVAVHKQPGGAGCPALTETRSCNIQGCVNPCTDADYSAWTTWSTCSRPCFDGRNAGSQTRTRIMMARLCTPPQTKQTQNCNERKRCECVLGDWGSWTSCSKSCGKGYEERKKSVLNMPTPNAFCDLDALQGRQRKACNLGPCAPTPKLRFAPTHPLKRLNLGSGNHELVTDAQAFYSGATKLSKILQSNHVLATEWQLPTNYDRVTALAVDDSHVYLGVKGSAASTTFKPRVYKLDKNPTIPGLGYKQKIKGSSYWELPSTNSNGADWSGYGDAIVIKTSTQTNTVFVSFGHAHNTLVVGVDKATDFTGGSTVHNGKYAEVRSIGQAGTLSLDASNDRLFCGTWRGALLAVVFGASGPWTQELVGSSGSDRIVQVVYNNGEIFAGTDNAIPKLLHFSSSQIASAAAFAAGAAPLQQAPAPAHERELPVAAGQCTAILADLSRVYCGTNKGVVLSVDRTARSLANFASSTFKDYIDVGKADPARPEPTQPLRFYAADAHDTKNAMYFVSYTSTRTSTVYEIDGYMTPKSCEMSQWSAWDAQCRHWESGKVARCGHGAKYRTRKITAEAQNGGTSCAELGATSEVQPCHVKDRNGVDKPCCHGGAVWTHVEQKVTCHPQRDAIVTAFTHSAAACRCPQAMPFAVGSNPTICASVHKKCRAQEAAKTCDFITCAYDETKGVILRHLPVRSKVKCAHKGSDCGKMKHRCAHQPGRLGGCKCLCWEE